MMKRTLLFIVIAILNNCCLPLLAMERKKRSYTLPLAKTAHQTTRSEKTSPHVAALAEDDKTVRALLADKLCTDPIDVYGLTPLHRAAAGGQTNVVQVLLDWYPLLNARGNNGETALHLAVLNNQPEVVTLLLYHKADINPVDNDNCTPYDYAVSNGHDCIDLLQSRGGIPATRVHSPQERRPERDPFEQERSVDQELEGPLEAIEQRRRARKSSKRAASAPLHRKSPAQKDPEPSLLRTLSAYLFQ